MAERIRFLMVGGFLGAGKTTTIGRLATLYQQQGLRVGLVTNDQAADLVDTHLLKSQGFDVGEVAGACFCCNFNELTDTMDRLSAQERPDLIIAEPVGSCTDLVATVAQPMMRLFGGEFGVGPYSVILKPSHGRKILRNERRAGFSPKAEYIFRKQLEEADVLLINRIDELEPTEVDDLAALLDEHYPGRTILRISARTGAGFEPLLRRLEDDGDVCRRILDLDYDTYAEGEAELGWLNANVTVSASDPFELDALLVALVDRLRAALRVAGAEPAHLKTIGLADGGHGVANLVSSDTPTCLSLASSVAPRRANLVVNARVAASPDTLETLVRRAIGEAAESFRAEADVRSLQSLSPGRPVPTHRYDSADASGHE